jgi:hypothetical protein
MTEPAQSSPGPDWSERSRGIVGESEELTDSLELHADARREFDAAREEHAARVAQLSDGDTPGVAEECLPSGIGGAQSGRGAGAQPSRLTARPPPAAVAYRHTP